MFLRINQKDKVDLFGAEWLSSESNSANKIKEHIPVMVVLGNPPYNSESKNNDKWILNLIQSYKREPNSKEKLAERNYKGLNDDYVKFIKLGEHFIEKNCSGIVAYITPHGFLDNVTFRGMRWNLLNTFDKIYTINLHGNARRKEKHPDGSVDENVFDIQQGVSINLFIKNNSKLPKTLADVYYYDVYGTRDYKFNFLNNNNNIDTINWEKVNYEFPYYFFMPKDFSNQKEYEKGFKIIELFKNNNTGFATSRDKLTIHFSQDDVKATIEEFLKTKDDEEAREKFNLGKDSRDWKVKYARQDLVNNYPASGNFTEINYRPFDIRNTFYTGKTNGFHDRPRKIMQHLINKDNIGLCLCRQISTGNVFNHIFITNKIIDMCFISNRGKENTYIFPLYLYKKDSQANLTISREPNFNNEIIKKFSDILGIEFIKEKEQSKNTFSPIDILDYIYAVLHISSYREKYIEFLKIDFPIIPYPKDLTYFWDLVSKGSILRKLHLLDTDVLNNIDFNISYPVIGSNKVEKVNYTNGRIYINKEQYFGNVPEVAWNFVIGSYTPLQMWLKYRKGRILSDNDITHYQNIVKSLLETSKIMQHIKNNILTCYVFTN